MIFAFLLVLLVTHLKKKKITKTKIKEFLPFIFIWESYPIR